MIRSSLFTLRAVLAVSLCALSTIGDAADREVVLGTAKDTQTSPGIVVANEKGFFAKHGIKANIRFFGNGAELIQAMAAGSVPVGAPGAVPATAARAGGVPIQIISTLSNVAGAQALLVGPNSGISKPADLQGKALGLVKSTTTELFYREVVKQYNLDASKITVHNLDGTGVVTALARGDIQAGIIFQPFALRAQALGAKVLLTGTRSYLTGKEVPHRTFGDYSLLVVRQDFKDANPELVKDILASVVEAYAYIGDHFDDAASAIAKALGQPVDDVKTFMRQNEYQLALSAQVVADLHAEAEFLASVGTVKQAVDPKTWIDPAPLRSLRPELVSY
jgi:aliphatic sulfonates family ABC transporter substrate-binding protein